MSNPKLERLQVEIDLKRAALFEHRQKLFALQTELADFASAYDAAVGSLEDELDAVYAEIEAETRHQQAPSMFGGDFATFADYLNARFYPKNEAIQPIKAVPDEDELRALYRRLARKFHPDTTTDPEEKARLSVIMARINAAYSAKDLAALKKIDQQPQAAVLEAIPGDPHRRHADSSKSELEELLEQSRLLDDEIAWTRIEYQQLMNGPLMALKIECSLAKGQGRNPLRDIADRVQRELDAARHRLATLRATRS